MLVGEALKKARESKGITQKQLAEMLYVDTSLICKMEKGKKKITLDNLIVILDIFEMTFEEFRKLAGK